MWMRWKERLSTLSAAELGFVTSKICGKNVYGVITSAKCIMKFNVKKQQNRGPVKESIVIKDIMNKLVCQEMMKVTAMSDTNFAYICKDSISGDMYGTKEGWPVFELTPADIKESKGTQKHKPGIVVARVFRIKRGKKWVDAKRINIYNIIGEKHVAFLVFLKGMY